MEETYLAPALRAGAAGRALAGPGAGSADEAGALSDRHRHASTAGDRAAPAAGHTRIGLRRRAALHLTQGRWYNSITALQQGDPLPDGASVFGTGAYYLGLELKADDGWALTDETRLCINRSANAALYTRQGATLLAICYRSQGDPETLPLSASTAPFSDLAPTDWYYSAAIYTYRLGLLQGTSATAFSPI